MVNYISSAFLFSKDIFYQDKEQIFSLRGSAIPGDPLVAKITGETRLKKLASKFVHVDKYGAKFRDDATADAFIKQMEKAK